MDPIDSDAALRGILGFLTLRPGDTDAEYFDGYTDAQRAFAERQAEELQEWGMDPKDSDCPDEAATYCRFVEIESCACGSGRVDPLAGTCPDCGVLLVQR